MSFPLGLEERAAIEAIHACNRLAPRLLDVIAQHEHAANVARPDWSGPHRDAFEDRFDSVQRAIATGARWVLQVRHEAEARLELARLKATDAANAIRTVGPR